MMCKLCGKEFGDGEICQHCGADKVSALGEFSGYSIPKKSTNAEPYSSEYCSSSHSVSPRIEDTPSMICWKCGEIIPNDSEYCPFCGGQLFVSCPKCGHRYSAQYPNCNKCGTNREQYLKQIKEQKEEEERQRKKEEDVRCQEELQKLKERSAQRSANWFLFVFFGLFTLWLILSSSEWFPILFGK